MLQELRDWWEELACRAGVDRLAPGGRRVLAVAAVIVIGLALWRSGVLSGSSRPVATAGPETEVSLPASGTTAAAAESQTTAPAFLTVQVAGLVRHPGVFRVPSGDRAIDAVTAAGGLMPGADQTGVNLAARCTDGEQIIVPAKGAASAPAGATGSNAGSSGGAAPGSSKVDLNTATVDQLDALPGIGPATAKKIVDDRTQNGPFRSVDDLQRISGIGPKKVDSLKDLVTVG